ncbi:MAG TPA: hypothetical protein VK150_01820 [Geothrix sp.]|nr:hypothetical protein [Geothrix sp.]
MFVLRRLPAALALLMLGALSLRLGLPFQAAVPAALALTVLLFVPRVLLQTTLAALLWAGALAWVGMAWLRVQERLAEGLPWLRLAAILGAVTLFTAWAAWLLHPRKTEG